jgi:hypothetical protein
MVFIGHNFSSAADSLGSVQLFAVFAMEVAILRQVFVDFLHVLMLFRFYCKLHIFG